MGNSSFLINILIEYFIKKKNHKMQKKIFRFFIFFHRVCSRAQLHKKHEDEKRKKQQKVKIGKL